MRVPAALIALALLAPGLASALRDVGTTAILYPVGVVPLDSPPQTVQALALVRNFGDSVESFAVFLRIDAGVIGSTQVESLSPQGADTVRIPFVVPAEGRHAAACSAALTVDENPVNDCLQDSFTVTARLRDIGVEALFLWPGDTVCLGESFSCTYGLTNYGNWSDSFPLVFTILRLPGREPVFGDTALVMIPPGSQLYQDFGPWLPSEQGVYECVLRIDTTQPLDTFSFQITVVPSAIEELHSRHSLKTGLTSVWPDPVVRFAHVTLQLGSGGRVTLGIRDVAGRTVAVLADGVVKAGEYRRDWEVAATVPAGIYFLSLKTPGLSETRKLVVAR